MLFVHILENFAKFEKKNGIASSYAPIETVPKLHIFAISEYSIIDLNDY